MAKEKKIFGMPLSRWKIIAFFSGLLLIYLFYQLIWASNIDINADRYYLYIDKKSSVAKVADTLKRRGVIRSRLSLRIIASFKGLDSISKGLYMLENRWNSREISEYFLHAKPQADVFVALPESRTRKAMLAELCKKTQVKPEEMIKKLSDKAYVERLGDFTTESIYSIFIPRNYRIAAKSTADELIRRLVQEFRFFWNDRRLAKAHDMGLTPQEVVTLASIVYAETKKEEELSLIAGVYFNRIQKKMKLESDPTVLYACQRNNAQRVLKKDLNVDSPYNTYKVSGLPPGPISIVPPQIIDRVLNYEGHDYFYFCADANLTGKHTFAETYEEHLENARKYHERMNEEGIRE